MKTEYQCTLEDYLHANRAHATPRSVKTWCLLAAAFLGLAACVTWAFLLPVVAASTTTTTAPANSASGGNLLVSLLPWGLLICVVATINSAGRTGFNRRRFDDLTRQKLPWLSAQMLLLGAFALALLAMAVNSVRTVDLTGVKSETEANVARYLPQIPWVFLFIFFVVLVRRINRLRRKQQPGLTRPRVFEFNAETVMNSDGISTGIYRWEAFYRCIETIDLFMLYPSGITFIMVPKRAFPSTDAIDGFRQLIREWADGRSVGFAVINPTSNDANC